MSNTHKIPSQYLYAFFFCVIGGYIFHLYAFTNIVPNSDGINRVFDLQEMTVSGRWFLHYATMPSGFMQMPTFIGLLTLVFLGLTAVLMVDLLQINHHYIAGFLGLSFVTFPSLGFTFLYLFTASAYSIGIFLAVFSLWLHQKGKKFYLLSVLALACSMGTYQAYAPFAIGLSVVLVMKKICQKEETLTTVTKYGIGKLLFLASGAAVYYVILEGILLLTGQELLPYLGMENSAYPFSALPQLILSSYKQVIVFFFLPQYGAGTTSIPLALANVVLVLFAAIALAVTLKAYVKEEKWRIFGLLALAAILPLAIGFVQIISPWSPPTPLMQYPYVIVYVFVLFLVDHAQLKCPIQMKRKFLLAVFSSMLVICLCGGWLCNLLYTSSAQAHRATESYVTRLMSRVESTSGYTWDMPVLIIGAFPNDRYFAQIEAYALIDHYSVPDDSVLPLNKHIYYYLNHWLNIPVAEPEESVMIAMSDSKEFAAMSCYPDDGSVQIIDQQVVVKVGESYTPKSDYELAYEASQRPSK